MSKQLHCKIISNEVLIPGIHKITFESSEISIIAVPGQFLEVRCADREDILLRRPISISNIDYQKNNVEIIFQIKGKGTEVLSNMMSGECLDVIGPLGNGFLLPQTSKKVALIGGGIGIFPLYLLANKLSGCEVHTYFGFRTKEFILLEKEFKEVSKKLTIATDDGSYGEKGLVIDLLKNDFKYEGFEIIYACGPTPMLKAVKEFTEDNKIFCQISVEQKMACGVGACLGCACKLKKDDDWVYGHVCKDGPVFDSNKIIFD